MRTATTFHQQQQQQHTTATTTAAKYVGNQKGKAAGKLAEYVNAINLLTGGHCVRMCVCMRVFVCVGVCIVLVIGFVTVSGKEKQSKYFLAN